MQQVKQKRSSQAIGFQIAALERQLAKPGVNKFALEGKIKNLKKELADAKEFEFLSK